MLKLAFIIFEGHFSDKKLVGGENCVNIVWSIYIVKILNLKYIVQTISFGHRPKH